MSSRPWFRSRPGSVPWPTTDPDAPELDLAGEDAEFRAIEAVARYAPETLKDPVPLPELESQPGRQEPQLSAPSRARRQILRTATRLWEEGYGLAREEHPSGQTAEEIDDDWGAFDEGDRENTYLLEASEMFRAKASLVGAQYFIKLDDGTTVGWGAAALREPGAKWVDLVYYDREMAARKACELTAPMRIRRQIMLDAGNSNFLETLEEIQAHWERGTKPLPADLGCVLGLAIEEFFGSGTPLGWWAEYVFRDLADGSTVAWIPKYVTEGVLRCRDLAWMDQAILSEPWDPLMPDRPRTMTATVGDEIAVVRFSWGADELMTPCAITDDWPRTNQRRGQLIEREARGLLSAKESDELEQLQRLADLRTDALDPFDFEELERLHAEKEVS